MKTIINVLLGLIVLLTGCRAEDNDTINNSRPRSPHLVDIRFVDEVGANLLDRVHLQVVPSGSFYLDSTQYSLDGWRNGVYIKPISQLIEMPAYPQQGTISVRYNFYAEAFSDSILNYKLEFTCPELFGNDLVHTIVIEKKAKNWGFMNNFERLLFDGEVIATNMEGDSSDNDRLPIVIVVPQK